MISKLFSRWPSSIFQVLFFIFKEKDDDGSGSHGSWLDLAIDNRTCEWCSAPYDMRNQLPSYVKVPLNDWHKDLLLDLCYCFDCVQEYHRLQEELDDESKKVFVLHCSMYIVYLRGIFLLLWLVKIYGCQWHGTVPIKVSYQLSFFRDETLVSQHEILVSWKLVTQLLFSQASKHGPSVNTVLKKTFASQGWAYVHDVVVLSFNAATTDRRL